MQRADDRRALYGLSSGMASPRDRMDALRQGVDNLARDLQFHGDLLACGDDCTRVQSSRNVPAAPCVDAPMSQESSDHPCLRCGACCAAYRVDFSVHEMEDEGGSVPARLAVEVNGSTCACAAPTTCRSAARR